MRRLFTTCRLSRGNEPHECKVWVVKEYLCVLQALSTLGNIPTVHNPQHLLLLLAFIHPTVVITISATQ